MFKKIMNDFGLKNVVGRRGVKAYLERKSILAQGKLPLIVLSPLDIYYNFFILLYRDILRKLILNDEKKEKNSDT